MSCRECEALAEQIANNTYRTNVLLAEMEAREQLPPDVPSPRDATP